MCVVEVEQSKYCITLDVGITLYQLTNGLMNCYSVVISIVKTLSTGRIWCLRQVTHLPRVWDLLLPRNRRDQQLLVSLPKDTGKVG